MEISQENLQILGLKWFKVALYNQALKVKLTLSPSPFLKLIPKYRSQGILAKKDYLWWVKNIGMLFHHFIVRDSNK